MSEGNADTLVLDARDEARMATTFGLLAVALSLVSPCVCYLPCIPAIILGIIAISKGRSAKLEFPDDDAVAGLAEVATALGLMSTIHAVLWLLVILAYLLFYVGLFAMMVFVA